QIFQGRLPDPVPEMVPACSPERADFDDEARARSVSAPRRISAERGAGSAIFLSEVAAPLCTAACGIVFNGRFGMSAATFVLPAHDDIAARAQLPHVATQVHVAVLQSHRVTDAQSVASFVAHLFPPDAGCIGLKREVAWEGGRRCSTGGESQLPAI